MTVLILSEVDVRATLDMPSCIEAMEGVLAGLAREELAMPLRFVFKPEQGAGQIMGFMPAWRGGAEAAWSLKEIVITPANTAEYGLDPHQGAVLLHDGPTGRLIAVLNASAITEIRTAAVSAVATKLLAPPGTSVVAILGSGVQGRSHAEAMREVFPDCELRICSRNPAHAEALALESHGVVSGCAEDAVRGAQVVNTCTASREPILFRDWLEPGAHVNAVGSSIRSARELEGAIVRDAALFVDRRDSTLNEAGDFLLAAEEHGLGPEHIKAELGEVLIGAHPGRSSAGELTVFKSLGIAVEDLAAAELCVRRARERGLGTEVDF